MLAPLLKRGFLSSFLLCLLLLSKLAMADSGSLKLVNNTDYTIWLSNIEGIVQISSGGRYESTVPTERHLNPRTKTQSDSSTASWNGWMVGGPCEYEVPVDQGGGGGACPSIDLNATLHILSKDEEKPPYGLVKYAREEIVRFFLILSPDWTQGNEFDFEGHKFRIDVDMKGVDNSYSHWTGFASSIGYSDVTITITQEPDK